MNVDNQSILVASPAGISGSNVPNEKVAGFAGRVVSCLQAVKGYLKEFVNLVKGKLKDFYQYCIKVIKDIITKFKKSDPQMNASFSSEAEYSVSMKLQKEPLSGSVTSSIKDDSGTVSEMTRHDRFYEWQMPLFCPAELPEQSCEKHFLAFSDYLTCCTDSEFEQLRKAIKKAPFKEYQLKPLLDFLKKSKKDILATAYTGKNARKLGNIVKLLGSIAGYKQLDEKGEGRLIIMLARRALLSGNLTNQQKIKLRQRLGAGQFGDVYAVHKPDSNGGLSAVFKVFMGPGNDNFKLKKLSKCLENGLFCNGEGLGLSVDLSNDHCPAVLGVITYSKALGYFRHITNTDTVAHFADDEVVCGVLTSFTPEAQTARELFSNSSRVKKLNDKEFAQVLLTFIRSAFGCLSGLQKKNVGHRDIKLDNTIVKMPAKRSKTSSNMQVQLIDFGMTKLVSTTQEKKWHKGSPYYLSPELYDYNTRNMRYDGDADPKLADVWAMGVCMVKIIFYRCAKNMSSNDVLMEFYTQHYPKHQSFSEFLKQKPQLDRNLKNFMAQEPKIFDLLDSIFVPEDKRASVVKIISDDYWKIQGET